MRPAEKDNVLRWNQRSRGFYEVYYFKFNDVAQGVAFWLRYTLLIPVEGRGEPLGELWGIFFDVRDPKNNRAWKESFPISRVSSKKDPFELRIRKSVLRHDMARGEIFSGAGHLKWDLRVEPRQEGYRNLPGLLYRLPLPKTKVVAPNLSCFYSGTVDIGDRVFTLSNAPGHQAHIWGTKHAAQWAWANCNVFTKGEDAVFEALSGQIKLGGWLTPPLSGVFLKVGQQVYPFNSYHQMLAINSHWDIYGWALEARSGRHRLLAQIRCHPKNMVGVEYRDPDGEPRVCNNTKVADLDIKVLEDPGDGPPVLIHSLESRQCCAFEAVGPEAVEGVPVLI